MVVNTRAHFNYDEFLNCCRGGHNVSLCLQIVFKPNETLALQVSYLLYCNDLSLHYLILGNLAY